MVRFIRTKALAALLGASALVIPADSARLSAGLFQRTKPAEEEQTIVVSEPGAPNRTCVILATDRQPDGTVLHKVKALDNGEVFTIPVPPDPTETADPVRKRAVAPTPAWNSVAGTASGSGWKLAPTTTPAPKAVSAASPYGTTTGAKPLPVERPTQASASPYGTTTGADRLDQPRGAMHAQVTPKYVPAQASSSPYGTAAGADQPDQPRGATYAQSTPTPYGAVAPAAPRTASKSPSVLPPAIALTPGGGPAMLPPLPVHATAPAPLPMPLGPAKMSVTSDLVEPQILVMPSGPVKLPEIGVPSGPAKMPEFRTAPEPVRQSFSLGQAQLEEVKDNLRRALRPSHRMKAAEELATGPHGRTPEARAELLRAAKEDPAGCVRATCIECLSHLGKPDAAFMVLLDGAKSDPDATVREEAELALKRAARK
jgi:hypothetical protein